MTISFMIFVFSLVCLMIVGFYLIGRIYDDLG
jgi:hypothetical protein